MAQGSGRDRLVHVAGASIPPRATSTRRRGPRPIVGEAPAFEFASTGPVALPLPPQDGSQLAANPLIQFFERDTHLGFPEVRHPTEQFGSHVFDQPGQTSTTANPEQFTQPRFETHHGLRGDLQLRLEVRGERVAEELAVPGPIHPLLSRLICKRKRSLKNRSMDANTRSPPRRLRT